MTFPGESLPVTDVGNVSGFAFMSWEAVAYRAETSVLTGGDEAWADVDLSPWLLADGDEAEVAWVLEVVAGSGTLALSEDGGSLGTHTISAGQLVVPSSLTAADILAGGTARLTVTCLTGGAEVQQVKLRVWPPGGALGGWSAPYQPPAVSRPVIGVLCAQEYATPTYLTGTNIDDVMHETQVELRGAFDGQPIGDPTLNTMTEFMVAAKFLAVSEETYGAVPPVRGNGNVAGGIAYLQRSAPLVPDPAGVYGIDWVWPPDEVPDDPDAWVVVGEDSWGWWQGVATVVIIDDDGPAGGVLRVGGDHVSGYDSPSATFGEVTDELLPSLVDVPLNDADGLLDFDLPPWDDDEPLIRIGFWHLGVKDDTEVPIHDTSPLGQLKSTGNANALILGGRGVEGDVDPLRASYTAGAYRYWTLAPADELIPLQWSQRHDGLAMAGVTSWRAARSSTPDLQWRVGP